MTLIAALPTQGVLAQLAIELTERSLCKTLDALRQAAHICSTAAADADAEPNHAAATPQQQDAALQAAEAAMNHTLRRLAVAQKLTAAAAWLLHRSQQQQQHLRSKDLTVQLLVASSWLHPASSRDSSSAAQPPLTPPAVCHRHFMLGWLQLLTLLLMPSVTVGVKSQAA
jgi:hypothetical protein